MVYTAGMADPLQPARQFPERRAPEIGSAFDVREWLAGLSGCDRDELTYEREFEEAGQLTVRYRCGETFLAVANMAGMRQAGKATWQLVAHLKDRAVTVMVPGGTKFVWR